MGLVNEQTRGSLRFSFGRFNNEADIDCALDYVTTPRAATVDATVSNSFGFGGHNAVLVLERSEARA